MTTDWRRPRRMHDPLITGAAGIVDNCHWPHPAVTGLVMRSSTCGHNPVQGMNAQQAAHSAVGDATLFGIGVIGYNDADRPMAYYRISPDSVAFHADRSGYAETADLSDEPMTRCPFCGTSGSVITGGEGTSHFAPSTAIDPERLASLLMDCFGSLPDNGRSAAEYIAAAYAEGGKR